MIQEIPVVGNRYHRAGILLQMLLQPVYGLGVEMVGRLIEQKHVGLLKQQTAQGHTATLAARECGHRLIVRRTLQGVHGPLELGVYVPGVGCVQTVLKFGLTRYQRIHLVGILKHVGIAESLIHAVKLSEHVHDRLHALAHHLNHGLLRIELRVLLQISHRIAGREHHLALIALVYAGYDLQQRGLTRAVQTDYTDLGAIEKREIYVFKHLLLRGIDLAHPHH